MKLIYIIFLVLESVKGQMEVDQGSLLEIMECLRIFQNDVDACVRNHRRINHAFGTVSRPIFNQIMFGAKKTASCEAGCRRENYYIDLERLESLTGWSYVSTKKHPLGHKKYMNIGQCRGSCNSGIRSRATCSHVGGEAIFQNKKGRRFIIEGFFADYCLCAYSAPDNCQQTI
jgi:hypothetical protein